MNETTEYTLSAEEQQLLAEFTTTIHDIQQQAMGALRMICKAQGLTGNWALDPTASKLVQQPNG